MHLETLVPETKQALELFGKTTWIKDFYLAGGTALALQYGHRQSVDLDWFSEKNFSTKVLLAKIAKLGRFELSNEEENTVDGYLGKAKISFMAYPYPLLAPSLCKKGREGWGFARLASPLDIALMKLTAISDRNTKKDFIDLYWYLHEEKTDLISLFTKMSKKFCGINYSVAHICKSLVYFVEADKQPMPRMFMPISWEKVKGYFLREIRKII